MKPLPVPASFTTSKVYPRLLYLLLANIFSLAVINGLIVNPSQRVNPVARRAELIERAKNLDPSLAKGEKKGSYADTGWSNRLGTVLTPVAIPGVYTSDRPFYWNRIDVGCKMTVIQLNNDKNSEDNKPSLFIHSPVGLDATLVKTLDELGTVEHIVSPNFEHVKYAKQWDEHYPNAKMWGCPGLSERETNINWFGEIPDGIRPKDVGKKDSGNVNLPSGFWNINELQPIHVNCEKNPFTGKPFFNEVIFYHTSSKSLLMTDLFWNYPDSIITNANFGTKIPPDEEEDEKDYGVWEIAPKVEKIPFGSRLWKFGMDQIYRPFFLNYMVQKDEDGLKTDYNDIVNCILNTWDVEVVVPAHGDIIRGKKLIRNILLEHFDYKP